MLQQKSQPTNMIKKNYISIMQNSVRLVISPPYGDSGIQAAPSCMGYFQSPSLKMVHAAVYTFLWSELSYIIKDPFFWVLSGGYHQGLEANHSSLSHELLQQGIYFIKPTRRVPDPGILRWILT